MKLKIIERISRIRMSKKKISSWIKKHWITIVLVSIGIVLLIGNICVLLFTNENNQSAWLTLISGWVSGIATVILGVIAVCQNRKYKQENEDYELSLAQREWRIEQKEEFKGYLHNIENIFQSIQENQFSKIIDECVYKFDSSPNTIVDIAYSHTIRSIYDQFVFVVINNGYYFDGTEELLSKCFEYVSKLIEQLDKLQENIENGESDFLEDLYVLYKDLVGSFNIYITELRIFIRYTMTNDSPANIEKKLKEMHEKQVAWREKKKSQLVQEK